MEEFKPNSNKSKEEAKERQKLEPVAKAKTVKKRNQNSLTDVFISEDAKNVKSFILMDILVPAAKKVIHDMITEGMDMILYGGSRKGSSSRSDYVSYRRYNDDRRDDRSYSRSTSSYNYGEVYFDSRGEAEDVLERLDEVMDRYNVVSVLDLYDLSGYPSEPQDNKYGWTNIRSAEIVRTRDGYKIKLPKPTTI